MTAPRDPSHFLTRQPLPRREPPVRRETWDEQVSVDRYIRAEMLRARNWLYGAIVLAAGGAGLAWLFLVGGAS